MIEDAPKFRLCCVGVMSSDGKTDHAITVVGHWVFDGKFTQGIPLNENSLDLCCSSIDRPTTYIKATKGIVLVNRS